MMGLSREGKGFSSWATVFTYGAVLFSWAVHATPSPVVEAHRSAGVEIGNGSLELGVGNSDSALSLPGAIGKWTRRFTENYTELVAPPDPSSGTQTKLRISLKDLEQPDEVQLKALEESGWRRFFWSDMDGFRRLDRPSPKKKSVLALEVRLFRDAREAIELTLIGNERSQSFAAIYDWLTPKKWRAEDSVAAE